MAEIVAMPKLGFDMAEGTLVRWVIGEGETVAKGAVLAEIETDKATVEVESSAEGILYRKLVDEGSVVPVGTPIAVVAAPGEEVKDVPEVSGQSSAVEQASPSTGATQPVQVAEKTAPPPVTPERTVKPIADQQKPAEVAGLIKVSPLARRMAEEHNLNLSQISGSGPEGRIVKKDIETALQTPPVTAAPAATPVMAQPVAGAMPRVGWTPGAPIPADQRLPVDKLRAIIGKRMSESTQQIPHFYVTTIHDVGPLMDLRKQLNAQLPEEDKLSINDFLIKAVALTLREFPNLNASLSGKEVLLHGHVNIGVAVALETGLMTVVCKDADQKPLRLIGREVREMAARARSGKVRPDDIEGSTFSISNLGMYNVEHFTAIINPPEAAILAVGSAQSVPVVINDEVTVGLRMKTTLSTDHRVSDGAEAARFMQTLGAFIENPLRMLV